jgi:hypothetical protein
MATAQAPVLDMNKLNNFIGQFVTDLGASVHAGMVVIGEKLGLYKALAEGPATSAELARKTGTDERYLREWLASQAAGGYVTYDSSKDAFSLNVEQTFTLANEDSPAYLPGALSSLLVHWLPSLASLRLSAPAKEWDGTNTMTASFTAARNSSAPDMRRTSLAHGYPLSMAC